jgi:hypothetical protein
MRNIWKDIMRTFDGMLTALKLWRPMGRRPVARSAALLIPLVLFACWLGCSDNPVTPETRIDTILSDELGPFIPGLIRGDTEFNGHGPLVTLTAELTVKGLDSLWCHISMRAEETEPDWSTAEDEWDTLVYRAPSGWKIIGICTDPPFCYQQYIDYDDDLDWLFCSGFIFQAQGDTPGTDINNGTQVRVQMRCTDVTIQKIE